MKKLLFTFWITAICYTQSFAQNCSTLNIQLKATINSPISQLEMTAMHDQLGRPYLYVANKEGGLKIYDISNLSSPSLVATVPTSQFDTLHVMNITQDSDYLYLAIGNHLGFNLQQAGMAIVDVSNPLSPVVTDYYIVPNSSSGSGIVKVAGNYAYLGAMQSGLVILNISNKNNIQFVSQYIPDINFPPVINPDSTKYNARGMVVKNSIVYLCYDAGGIRIINCTNKNAPVETGHWCNPAMYTPFGHPRAYNNAVLDDSLLYVAVDYAGMEVLDVADTGNISMLGWWNPYNAPNTNWFGCNIHTNDIRYNPSCKHVFLSSGKSEMHVIDVSDPTQPDSCNAYGNTLDTMGTYGLGMWQNQLYLAYTYIPYGTPFAPFYSNATEVRILTYTPCTNDIKNYPQHNKIKLFPVPANNKLIIENCPSEENKIFITNMLGQTFPAKYTYKDENKAFIDISNLSDGIYLLHLHNITKRFIKASDQ